MHFSFTFPPLNNSRISFLITWPDMCPHTFQNLYNSIPRKPKTVAKVNRGHSPWLPNNCSSLGRLIFCEYICDVAV